MQRYMAIAQIMVFLLVVGTEPSFSVKLPNDSNKSSTSKSPITEQTSPKKGVQLYSAPRLYIAFEVLIYGNGEREDNHGTTTWVINRKYSGIIKLAGRIESPIANNSQMSRMKPGMTHQQMAAILRQMDKNKQKLVMWNQNAQRKMRYDIQVMIDDAKIQDLYKINRHITETWSCDSSLKDHPTTMAMVRLNTAENMTMNVNLPLMLDDPQGKLAYQKVTKTNPPDLDDGTVNEQRKAHSVTLPLLKSPSGEDLVGSWSIVHSRKINPLAAQTEYDSGVFVPKEKGLFPNFPNSDGKVKVRIKYRVSASL